MSKVAYRQPPYSIVVTSGVGQVTLTSAYGYKARCITRGITPPVASPNATYSWYVQDQYGGITDSGNGSGRQNWDGEKAYVGALIFYIVSASADGTYTLDLWLDGEAQPV